MDVKKVILIFSHCTELGGVDGAIAPMDDVSCATGIAALLRDSARA